MKNYALCKHLPSLDYTLNYILNYTLNYTLNFTLFSLCCSYTLGYLCASWSQHRAQTTWYGLTKIFALGGKILTTDQKF